MQLYIRFNIAYRHSGKAKTSYFAINELIEFLSSRMLYKKYIFMEEIIVQNYRKEKNN